MSLFFADTFYWIALTNPKDSAHKKVLQFTAKLAARSVITTDEVLSEFLAFVLLIKGCVERLGWRWID